MDTWREMGGKGLESPRSHSWSSKRSIFSSEVFYSVVNPIFIENFVFLSLEVPFSFFICSVSFFIMFIFYSTFLSTFLIAFLKSFDIGKE